MSAPRGPIAAQAQARGRFVQRVGAFQGVGQASRFSRAPCRQRRLPGADRRRGEPIAPARALGREPVVEVRAGAVQVRQQGELGAVQLGRQDAGVAAFRRRQQPVKVAFETTWPHLRLVAPHTQQRQDRKSTRLNSSHSR